MGFVDADADQVTAAYRESLGKAPHPGPLQSVDCVKRVITAAEGADFDNNRGGAVTSDDVDLPTGDNHVTGDDMEALLVQVDAGKILAKISSGQTC